MDSEQNTHKLTKMQVRDFSLLNKVSTILSSSLNLKESLEKIFELLESTIDIQKGLICLSDSAQKELKIELAYGLSSEDSSGDNIFIWKQYSELIFTDQSDVIIENLANEGSLFKKYYTNLAAQSFIGTPITIGHVHYGVLCVKCDIVPDTESTRRLELLKFFSLLIAQELKLKSLLESERDAILTENTQLRDELKSRYKIDNMIGKSSSMISVFEGISQVASSNASVLIRGESGTGKELVAHAIHYNSSRNNQPFVKINCGAIPESLIESELFGHEKGSFTDAYSQKIGKFEMANGGTLFLDEIAELSRPVQVKLLRVLQEKEIDRVGGTQPISVDVRIITATNRNLEREIEEESFREDLYYRLNVFPIFIPPLRERKSDIILLAEHFLEKYKTESQKKITSISPLAIDMLIGYHWPGNVRELENSIERATLLCSSDTVQAQDLPSSLHQIESIESRSKALSFSELVENFEREIIIETLVKFKGNKTKAADHLKTTQRILGYKISNLGINIQEYKYH